MSVIVTKHAEKRLRERMGLGKKSIQRAAETAFDKGIKHCETTGNLNKWVTSLYFNNKTANNIRLYNDKAWIFAGKNLITVLQIPASLKKSVKDVLDRRKNSEEESHLNMLREAKTAFLNGSWVESEKVQELTGMTFSECFSAFDFSRTAEWWSVVGKTEEERQLNGQKVTNLFRLKEGQKIDPIPWRCIMSEVLTILRRLLFSRVGCINRQKDECMFLMNGTRGGRKCCFKQCQEVQKHLTKGGMP